MPELMDVHSVVCRTSVLGFLLTALSCVSEVPVAFAQPGENVSIEKTADKATEKAIQKAPKRPMEKASAKMATEKAVQEEFDAKLP
ncbi:MAG: hypothetical protein OEZ05_17100 [Nitrospirota bacterium]|nr:hypothetical protein [Nitrospirota bacterium]MDH5588336.1 hypothetical protein [Nitrospirota bacterium]